MSIFIQEVKKFLNQLQINSIDYDNSCILNNKNNYYFKSIKKRLLNSQFKISFLIASTRLLSKLLSTIESAHADP